MNYGLIPHSAIDLSVGKIYAFWYFRVISKQNSLAQSRLRYIRFFNFFYSLFHYKILTLGVNPMLNLPYSRTNF